MEEKECPYCFIGPKKGICDVAIQFKDQAEVGGLSQEDWDAYVERTKIALKKCLFPDQLSEAISSAQPKLRKED